MAALAGPGSPYEMAEVDALGRRVRSYVNLPASLRAIFDGSRAYGGRDFLVYEEERVSFDAHWRAATAFGHALASRFGIGKGDRVAIAMRNYPEWSVCAWGALAIGAVLVPLNAWDSGDVLAASLADSGARVLVADTERLARLEGHLRDPAPIVVRDAGNHATALESLIGAGADYATLDPAPLPDPGIAQDDLATIFYTSGTTGRPKGAAGTHGNVLTNLVNTGVRAARAALRRGDTLPLSPAAVPRRLLLPLPLFHVTGFHSTLVPALAGGNTIHLMYKWDVAQALDLIERERINALTLVPSLVWQLTDALDAQPRDLSSVDTVGYGGASAAPELAARVRAHFPGAMPGQGYGATETSSLVAANSHEDMLARPGSVGLVMPCCDVRIVDANGHGVSAGEPGEIWVSGPNVVSGYWNMPEATAASFTGGWYRTGDIGRVDEEGFIFILDRIKDMLIRGGENIYCAEIEDCLMAHVAVVEAAVFGVPERMLGEVPAATVRLRGGSSADADALRRHVAARLAAHKVPVCIALSIAELPRNAAGKVLKHELRAALLEQQSEE